MDDDLIEKIICFKAMTDGAYLSAVADFVKPEYFGDKNIATFFQIVNDFYDKRKKLPTITEVKTYLTTDELKNGFRKIVESFKSLDHNLDKDELYDNTERFLKERGILNELLKSVQEMEKDGINMDGIVDRFEKITAICLNMNRGFEIFSGVDSLINHILNVEKMIPSGWDFLDNAVGGGFLEDGKALYMFIGEANIGKSIFLGNVAANIAKRNKTVLVISLEMSEMIYAQRISSNITKIPMKDFKTDTHSLRDSLNDEKRKLPKSKIFIKEFPPSTVTPKQISAFVKKLEDTGEKIDAIVIDYLGLLHSPIGSNSYERLKYICEQVRAMSYVFKCPVISAGQMGRQFFNTENPGMSGIAESIGIAATADVIMSIFQNEEDRELGIIRLGMMKNRYGPRGHTQAMKIDYSTLSITQTEEEEEIMCDEDLSKLELFAD